MMGGVARPKSDRTVTKPDVRQQRRLAGQHTFFHVLSRAPTPVMLQRPLVANKTQERMRQRSNSEVHGIGEQPSLGNLR